MESKETFRIVRWRENPHLDVVCVNLMEATKYVEEYNSRAGNQECYVDEDIWHPLSYHETLKLEEQITLLTTQRDGYKTELEAQVKANNELSEALKKSQEESKEWSEIVDGHIAIIREIRGKAARVEELEEENKKLKEENIWLDANCHTHGKNVGRILKMKEIIEEVVTNVKNRKGTDQEMKLSIHDYTILKQGIKI
jgi:hypothetical protein